MKHFDLFSGYGGFSIAGRRCGFETIGFSEIDKYAIGVLKNKFPNTKNYGDIAKINWAEIPDFDLLTGGSPCQDLSIAGKRAGIDGARSGLFFEYIRAVKEKNLSILSGKMLKGLCHQTRDLISLGCSTSFPKQGILSGGKFSTQKISVCPKTESVYLSSVLETEVPQKYFLSEKAINRLGEYLNLTVQDIQMIESIR